MILWPRRREARLLEPRIRVNPRILELQMAKEILAEIFHARPGEVEEMIQNRMEERSWRMESWQSGVINLEANIISSAHHF